MKSLTDTIKHFEGSDTLLNLSLDGSEGPKASVRILKAGKGAVVVQMFGMFNTFECCRVLPYSEVTHIAVLPDAPKLVGEMEVVSGVCSALDLSSVASAALGLCGNGFLCELFLYDGSFIGFVSEADRDHVLLDEYDEERYKINGQVLVSLGSVEIIDIFPLTRMPLAEAKS